MPLTFLLVATFAFRIWNLDLAIERWFWSKESGWSMREQGWIQSLYQYGPWPALLAAGAGALAWIISYFWPPLRRWRFLGALMALTLIIGPGLIVNAGFKDHFGRPRPRQVLEFGGRKAFLPVGNPDLGFDGKSFPSGHASVGFLWFAAFIYFWQTRRGLAWLFALLALLHGGAMGLGRIAQGGHWPSDILWAAGFVYLTAWAVYRAIMFFSVRQRPSSHNPLVRRRAGKRVDRHGV